MKTPLSHRVQAASDDPDYIAALDEFEAVSNGNDELAINSAWRALQDASRAAQAKIMGRK